MKQIHHCSSLGVKRILRKLTGPGARDAGLASNASARLYKCVQRQVLYDRHLRHFANSHLDLTLQKFFVLTMPGATDLWQHW